MMSLQGDRTTDQGNLSASCSTFFGQRITHLTRRVVTDKTYRVNLFVSRSGSDDYLLVLQILLLGKESFEHFDNLFRFFHASLTHQVTGQFAFSRFDDVISIGAENVQILLSGRMGKHVQVHGRSHKYRSLHGKIGGNEHVVCYSMRHLSNGTGSGRSNDHGICPKTQIHMAMPSTVPLREKFADNRLASQSRQGDGRNEFLSGRCNHHLHFRPFFNKSSYEYSRFVGGYASGNT